MIAHYLTECQVKYSMLLIGLN